MKSERQDFLKITEAGPLSVVDNFKDHPQVKFMKIVKEKYLVECNFDQILDQFSKVILSPKHTTKVESFFTSISHCDKGSSID